MQATADSRQLKQPATVPHVGHAALPSLLCRARYCFGAGQATSESKVTGRAPIYSHL
jgi:hypothetical protein